MLSLTALRTWLIKIFVRWNTLREILNTLITYCPLFYLTTSRCFLPYQYAGSTLNFSSNAMKISELYRKVTVFYQFAAQNLNFFYLIHTSHFETHCVHQEYDLFPHWHWNYFEIVYFNKIIKFRMVDVLFLPKIFFNSVLLSTCF